MPIIDFHSHIFPDTVHRFLPNRLREQARVLFKPVISTMHRAQTFMRWLPEPILRSVEQLSALAPIPGLLIESSADDLKSAMEEAGVDYSVVIAHPPGITNEYVLEVCQDSPTLIPAVNIPSGTAFPGKKLKEYVDRGAKILKIHPASDGEGVDSPRYKILLTAASDLGLPVILHTGCFHSNIYYKDPLQGKAERFAPWFSAFPKITFVLAHMNYHEPNVALDLAEENGNVLVDTSWQPPEVIGEAVRRIGNDRILFGTDWPFIGQNLEIGIKRIRDCVASGVLDEEGAEAILGGNAARVLGVHAGKA